MLAKYLKTILLVFICYKFSDTKITYIESSRSASSPTQHNWTKWNKTKQNQWVFVLFETSNSDQMVLNQIAKIGTKTIKYALTIVKYIYANVVLKRPVFFSLSHSIILYMLLSHPLICSILTIMNANKTQIK